jgi:hypothetical protein
MGGPAAGDSAGGGLLRAAFKQSWASSLRRRRDRVDSDGAS